MTFEEYVRLRASAMLRLAFVLTGDQHRAEDLVQTTLAHALAHWRKIDRSDHPDRYLHRVMVNLLLQDRRRRAGSEVVVADAGDLLPEVQDVAQVAGDRDEARRMLATLPDRARLILVLRYYLDWDSDSIADHLGMTPGSVRSSTSRSIRTLQENTGRITGGGSRNERENGIRDSGTRSLRSSGA